MSSFYDQILAYKKGLLSTEEKLLFELEMAENEDLRSAVDNSDLMEVIGDAIFEEETKKMIDDALENPPSNRPKTSKGVLILIGILLLSMIGYFVFQNSVKKKEALIVSVMEEYTPPQVMTERGEVLINSSPLNKAKEAFSKREFDKAKDILLTSNFKSEDEEEVHFLLAHIYFIERQFAQSKREIDKVKNRDMSTLRDLLDKVLK